ncbi:MAG: YARHG domain-containing protein [Bacteroidota bacterium]|nr:YARHG domain-containing protein [Bacteroidota bacterium]
MKRLWFFLCIISAILFSCKSNDKVSGISNNGSNNTGNENSNSNNTSSNQKESAEEESNITQKELNQQNISGRRKKTPITSSNQENSIPDNEGIVSSRYLTDSDLKDLSTEELKILRNEIYARHGYIFKTADMKTYFSGKSWYHPQYEIVTDNMLSGIEKANRDLIKKYEK